MHILQPKHTKLKSEEIDKLLKKYNIVLVQLPKISKNDAGLCEECVPGDVIKIEKGDEVYYRVVI